MLKMKVIDCFKPQYLVTTNLNVHIKPLPDWLDLFPIDAIFEKERQKKIKIKLLPQYDQFVIVYACRLRVPTAVDKLPVVHDHSYD